MYSTDDQMINLTTFTYVILMLIINSQSTKLNIAKLRINGHMTKIQANMKMPIIGYGSDNTTKYYLPNGLKKYVVKDLYMLLMNNRSFHAEITHSEN